MYALIKNIVVKFKYLRTLWSIQTLFLITAKLF